MRPGEESRLSPRFEAPATGRSVVPFTEMGTMWGSGRMIWGTRMDSSVLDIAMPLKKPLGNAEQPFECRYLVSQKKQSWRGKIGYDLHVGMNEMAQGERLE